jgi:hypothetical protein
LTSVGCRVSRWLASGGTLLNGFSSFLFITISRSNTAYKFLFFFHSLLFVTCDSLRHYTYQHEYKLTHCSTLIRSCLRWPVVAVDRPWGCWYRFSISRRIVTNF